MAMGGGGSTYKSADGIWHAAIDIEPDRATGRRRRLTAQGKTKAVANARLRMKLDAYVRKGFTPNSPSPRLIITAHNTILPTLVSATPTMNEDQCNHHSGD